MNTYQIKDRIISFILIFVVSFSCSKAMCVNAQITYTGCGSKLWTFTSFNKSEFDKCNLIKGYPCYKYTKIYSYCRDDVAAYISDYNKSEPGSYASSTIKSTLATSGLAAAKKALVKFFPKFAAKVNPYIGAATVMYDVISFLDTYSTKSQIAWLQRTVDSGYGVQVIFFKSKGKNDSGDKYSNGGSWMVEWDGTFMNGEFGCEPTFAVPYGHNGSFSTF